MLDYYNERECKTESPAKDVIEIGRRKLIFFQKNSEVY